MIFIAFLIRYCELDDLAGALTTSGMHTHTLAHYYYKYEIWWGGGAIVFFWFCVCFLEIIFGS